MKLRHMVSLLSVLSLLFSGISGVPISAKTMRLTNAADRKILYTGSTFALKTNMPSPSLRFSSNKKTVASVSEDGIITAGKIGNATVTITSGNQKKKLRVTVKKPVGYSISKKSGTYTNSVTTTVRAGKKYNVYYSLNNRFRASRRIKAGSAKTFTFSKSSTLRLYPVKKSETLATAKRNSKKNTSLLRSNYRYTITKKEGSSAPGTAVPVQPSATPYAAASANPAAPGISGNPGGPANPATTDIPNSPGSPNNPTPSDIPSDPGYSPLPTETPKDGDLTVDDSQSDYIAPVRSSYDDIDLGETISADATVINLPATASGSKVTEAAYEISKKNKLTITAPGTYVIRTDSLNGVCDGLIEADFPDGVTGSVHLILDNVSLTSSNNTAPSSDTGLVTIKKSVSRAVITIPEGTVTTLEDTGLTGVDKDDAASTTYTGGIVCKKTPLTINGSGTLNIHTANGNGIKATQSLKIVHTNISVSGINGTAAGRTGISGKTELAVKDAHLTIYSDGDCIKTTLDETDIAEDTTGTLASLGNMDLDGGTYQIISANGDGVSAARTLYLNPSELSVTTRNEAASTGDGSYKGIKAVTTVYIPETAGIITVDTTATYSASRSRGDSNDPYADDAIHCNNYIRIDGGVLRLAAGDDGIHSDAGLYIRGGDIAVSESYEGIESGDITIDGGMINVTARDDGLNAAGGNDTFSGNATESGIDFPNDPFHKGNTSSATQYQIIINDGELTVDAGGDGIDSNGSIFFRGGTVTVNGPTNSGNGALDYGDGSGCVCEISGGTLIAAGAVGMDDAPTSGSSQPVVNVRLSSVQSPGTYVTLRDSDGETILSAQPTKTFQSVIMSCEALTMGSTYTVYYGSSPDNLTTGDSFTFSSTSVSTGSGGGGGWRPGPGGWPGGWH